jgi:hypothetical protein
LKQLSGVDLSLKAIAKLLAAIGLGERGDVHFKLASASRFFRREALMKPFFLLAAVVAILLHVTTSPTCAGLHRGNTRSNTLSPTEPVLNKENLDRVKRFILGTGRRCTYVNMFNNNPCFELADFEFYLNPDPGPNGHPQWNINCDATRGDFNTLAVREKGAAGGYHVIDFQPGQALTIRASYWADTNDMGKSRKVLEAAVLTMLKTIDPGSKAPHGTAG